MPANFIPQYNMCLKDRGKIRNIRVTHLNTHSRNRSTTYLKDIFIYLVSFGIKPEFLGWRYVDSYVPKVVQCISSERSGKVAGIGGITAEYAPDVNSLNETTAI